MEVVFQKIYVIFLLNRNVVKVGVGVDGDSKKLGRDHGLQVKNIDFFFFDLVKIG